MGIYSVILVAGLFVAHTSGAHDNITFPIDTIWGGNSQFVVMAREQYLLSGVCAQDGNQ